MNLDLRHLGRKKLQERLPLICELAEEYMGIDPTQECIPVRPGIHYTMGGIYANLETETPLPGLYAAGECASNGIHGANRLGSNSLVDIIVFGKLAGEQAAQYARGVQSSEPASLAKLADDAEQRALSIVIQTDGSEKHSVLRREMSQSMESGCGIYRTADEMQSTCDKLAELRARYCNINVEDKSSVWNSDWLGALEVGYLLEVAEAVAHSALNRKESRGAHQRLDDFMNKLAQIKPYLIPKRLRRLDQGEYLQTPQQLEQYRQFSTCINCLLCYAACPQYDMNSDFTGPGILALMHRYNADSRDDGSAQRMELGHADAGVWGCTAVGYCSEVCPKDVDPAHAINQNKMGSAIEYFLRFIRPRGATK